MALRTLSTALFVFTGLTPAFADDPSAVAKEKQTIESYAATNTSCHEWTDGCLICLRHEDGSFACSLPGIACQPTGLTCRADKAPVPK